MLIATQERLAVVFQVLVYLDSGLNFTYPTRNQIAFDDYPSKYSTTRAI